MAVREMLVSFTGYAFTPTVHLEGHMRTIGNMSTWFDRFYPDGDGTNSVYPFKVRISLPGWAVTPRHPMFEYVRDMGASLLQAIVLHQPLPIEAGTTLLLILPERHLSVHEQHALLDRLRSHPDVGLIAGVDIMSQSPLIVQNAPDGCLLMFNIAADDPHQGWVERRT